MNVISWFRWIIKIWQKYHLNFKILCENGHELTAYLAGKMRRFYIKVLPGDRVAVEISPYDLTKGRITKRLKEGEQS